MSESLKMKCPYCGTINNHGIEKMPSKIVQWRKLDTSIFKRIFGSNIYARERVRKCTNSKCKMTYETFEMSGEYFRLLMNKIADFVRDADSKQYAEEQYLEKNKYAKLAEGYISELRAENKELRLQNKELMTERESFKKWLEQSPKFTNATANSKGESYDSNNSSNL